MENKVLVNGNVNHPHILVLIPKPDHQQEVDSTIDIFLFLLHYTFLLIDTPQENNFLKRDFPPPGDISTKNPNGARYLDPKYSRWISTDPALDEYMKPDKEKKYGVFDFVNLNVYHYGHNNPIIYIDPDGRADVWLAFEWVAMGGTDSRLYNYGGTSLYGKAHVTFMNLSTHESFSQTYDILCLNSLGINFQVGGSAGFTSYSRIFPENTTKETILESYTGIFASITSPVSWALSVFDIAGFSISNTIVVGLNPNYDIGIDLNKEIPWFGSNLSLNGNVCDLAVPGGIGLPNISIQYQIYKLPNQKWEEYQKEFDASAKYSNSFSSAFPFAQLIDQFSSIINGSKKLTDN